MKNKKKMKDLWIEIEKTRSSIRMLKAKLKNLLFDYYRASGYTTDQADLLIKD